MFCVISLAGVGVGVGVGVGGGVREGITVSGNHIEVVSDGAFSV